MRGNNLAGRDESLKRIRRKFAVHNSAISYDSTVSGSLIIISSPPLSKTPSYSLTIDPHEGGYLASFPALPGCNTWGSTYEDAVKHAEEALAVYLETLAEHGDAIPEEDASAPVSLGVTVRTSTIA
jgi:antitoxin HicB